MAYRTRLDAARMLLARRAHTLYDLGEALACSPRNARRLIYALQDAGVQVTVTTRSQRGHVNEYQVTDKVRTK